MKKVGVAKLQFILDQATSDEKRHYDLIQKISDFKLLIQVYELIKPNPGNMTKGSSDETLDGINLQFFKHLANQLRRGEYEFRPGRRVWINKPGKIIKRSLRISVLGPPKRP